MPGLYHVSAYARLCHCPCLCLCLCLGSTVPSGILSVLQMNISVFVKVFSGTIKISNEFEKVI